MDKYYLYILHSPTLERYYIGISHDPLLRLHYHNTEHKGWTRRGRPWKLAFTKAFPSKLEAQKWERWIKRQKDRNIIGAIIKETFQWS